jgi:hypothetical protein
VDEDEGQSEWRKTRWERIRLDENVVGPFLPLVRFNIGKRDTYVWPRVDPDDGTLCSPGGIEAFSTNGV